MIKLANNISIIIVNQNKGVHYHKPYAIKIPMQLTEYREYYTGSLYFSLAGKWANAYWNNKL